MAEKTNKSTRRHIDPGVRNCVCRAPFSFFFTAVWYEQNVVSENRQCLSPGANDFEFKFFFDKNCASLLGASAKSVPSFLPAKGRLRMRCRDRLEIQQKSLFAKYGESVTRSTARPGVTLLRYKRLRASSVCSGRLLTAVYVYAIKKNTHTKKTIELAPGRQPIFNNVVKYRILT